MSVSPEFIVEALTPTSHIVGVPGTRIFKEETQIR